MKYLKKFASLALALVMVLALAAPAFADGESDSTTDADAGKVELSNKNTAHSYRVYQIFTADPSEDGASLNLETIKWGAHVNPANFWTVVQAFCAKQNPAIDTSDALDDGDGGTFDVKSDSGAKAIAKFLAENFARGNTEKDIPVNKELAEMLATNTNPAVTGDRGYDVNEQNNNTNKVLPGYYLIADSMDGGETYADYMLYNVVQNTEITAKTSDETVDKKVKAPETSTESSTDWVDAAVYDQTNSEEVEFKLTVNLPTDLGTFKNATNSDGTTGYNIVLEDNQGTGLELLNTENVKSNFTVTGFKKGETTGSAITDFEVEHNAHEDAGCTFTISINRVEELQQVNAEGKIEIVYTAKLTDEATTGNPGNKNEVNLKVNGKDVGKDNATVYELELNLDKVKADGTALPGATFALIPANLVEKWDYTKLTWVTEGTNAATEEDQAKMITLTADQGTNQNHHVITGVPEGSYYLVETKTPNTETVTYNPIKPIKIDISADITTPGNTLDVTIDEDNKDFSVVEPSEVIHAEIENTSGSMLPETGGIGTTIFYIVGGVLLVGAVVLLIAKRRTSADEE